MTTTVSDEPAACIIAEDGSNLSPQHCYISTTLHGITFQKTVISNFKTADKNFKLQIC